jgi:hypothetical protein
LSLYLVAQGLLCGQYPTGWRPDGSVIEVDAARIEQPVLEHRTAKFHSRILFSGLANLRAIRPMDCRPEVEYERFWFALGV